MKKYLSLFRDKKIVTLVFWLLLVVLVISGLLIFILSERTAKTSEKINNSTSEKSETSIEQKSIKNEVAESNNSEPTAEKKPIYFGQGWDGKNFAINMKTEEIKDITPLGYKIVDQFNYQNFPAFLILQKDNLVYYFDLKNNKIINIINSNNNLKLKNDERLMVTPSFTEKNKFFIAVNKIDLSLVNEMGGLSAISSEYYLFDAEKGELSKTKIENLDSCFEYDSKNQRFFTWLCGEGNGSSAPLSIVEINSNFKKNIITPVDFGLQENDLVKVEYNNGLFFVYNYGVGNGIKMIVINAKIPGYLKEEYLINKEMEGELDSVYSIALDKERKLLIIGSNYSIRFLRFDSNNSIFEAQNIPGDHVYANFIFLNDDRLYYLADNYINIINLDNLKVEKLIPASEDYQEIALFYF